MKNTEFINELQNQIPQSVFAFGLTNIGCIQEGITHHIVVPAKTPQNPERESNFQSPVYLANFRGARIDLIRVINSLYEIGFFVSVTGARIPKKVVFETLGIFLNMDLSHYENDLSNSMMTGLTTEKQTRIFEQLLKTHLDIFNRK